MRTGKEFSWNIINNCVFDSVELISTGEDKAKKTFLAINLSDQDGTPFEAILNRIDNPMAKDITFSSVAQQLGVYLKKGTTKEFLAAFNEKTGAPFKVLCKPTRYTITDEDLEKVTKIRLDMIISPREIKIFDMLRTEEV